VQHMVGSEEGTVHFVRAHGGRTVVSVCVRTTSHCEIYSCRERSVRLLFIERYSSGCRRKAMSLYYRVQPSLYMPTAKIVYRHDSVCCRTNKVLVMKGCFRPLHSPSTFPLAREANATHPCSCCPFPSNQHHQWITYYHHHTACCGCFGSTGKYPEGIQGSQGDLRLDVSTIVFRGPNQGVATGGA
jgi:hypothetical protein